MVQRRFVDWATAHARPLTEDSAMTWVATAPTLKYSTRSQYFSHVMKLIDPVETVKVFRRGLAAMVAREHMKQAAVLTDEEVMEVFRHLKTRRDRVVFYIGIRTACRTDEMSALTSEKIVGYDRTGIYIHWGVDTKGTRFHKYRPDTYVELRTPHVNTRYHYPVTMSEVAQVVRKVATNEGPTAPLSRLTYPQWLAVMRKVNPQASGHSIKRTAMTRAQRAITENRLPPELWARLAKHKEAQPKVGETTLRYGGDSVRSAKMLGTGELTQHL